MKLLKLEVGGFRSFNSPQVLDFTRLRPGLYHLAGCNEVEPALEGNGAGKSSLLEAVCWGLYGRTSRNLRAGAVKSWGSKEKCAVLLDVQTTSGDVSIFRVWQPNLLEVSVNGGVAKPVDQKTLDQLLGVSPEAFLFSIYFAQFTPAFIDLRPAEQMSVYSTVLGLDLWERAADAASKQARGLDGTLAQLRERAARLDGQIQELAALNFDQEDRAWTAAHKQRSDATTTALNKLQPLLAHTAAQVKKYSAAAAQFRTANTEATRLGAELRNAQSNLQFAAKEHAKLSAAATRGVCPMCGAKMSKTHAEDERAKATALVDKGQRDVVRLGKLAKAAVAEAEKLQSADREHINAVSVYEQHHAQERELAARLKNSQVEVNPHTAKRRQVEATLKQIRAQAVEAVAELANTETQHQGTQFWTKGFKELRLSLVEDSLTQLTLESNASLLDLGLGTDWALRYDIERETKSGGVSRGFTVLVDAPHVKDPVPWEAWSGGESQRLRVASSLGFGELICSRMGLAPNVELFDEPSTWLSAQGIHDLLETLAARAEQRGKVILLADHRALEFGGFSGTITVTKTTAGSTIGMSV